MKPLFRLLALAALLLAPSVGSAQGPSAEEIARQATAEFQAANYDEAIKVAKECPITYMPDYNIEIREMMGFDN